MANSIVLNIDTTKSEFQNPMVQLRQGDGNYQSLAVTVTSNGEPFDLTGWTITFMGTTASGFKIVDTASVVIDASQGKLTYTPTKAWGQDQGEFKNAYFKFTKADETASGASFRVNVLDAVDLTAEEAKDYISVVDVMIDQVKTDMETKLAETKQTLADTQSQANVVQTNVNNLNTSVNDLKTQNINIKTTNNTWTGRNTYTQQIIGSFYTRNANFTDFATVATDMFTYSGIWYVNGSVILNKPSVLGNYFIVSVTPANIPGSGKIEVFEFTSGKTYISNVSLNTLGRWLLLADDSKVVHNTGTETIAGDKTFTGNNIFTQNISGNITGNSGTTTKLQTPRKINGTNFDGTADINVNAANDSNLVHLTVAETVTGDKTFTGKNTFTGQTSFWFKQIQWTSGIMQGTWYIQRIGNWVNAKFDMSADTGTGTTTLTLPVGYRPLSTFVRELEQGAAGINNNGTILVSQSYTGVNAMTFSYPTNDAWPTA